MADLDDFFAKKDRKKSKGKKFTTADEIAKRLEETGKKNEKLKKDKLQSQSSGQEVDEQGNKIQDEDEWKDFEEEKKDYTGLKIQNLTVNDSEDGENGASGGEDEDGGMEENEAGELVPRKKTGPWKVVAEQAPPPVVEEEAPPPPQPSSPGKTSGSYKPPALRNAPTLSGSRFRGKMAAAPDVKNEELFPSLSAAKVHEPNKKKKEEGGSGGSGFEEVKAWRASNPGRYEPPHLRQGRLTLGNKYGALSDS